MKHFYSIFTMIILFSHQNATAQQLELGVNAGGASYLGDLNQFNPVKISGLSAGAFVRLNFTPHIGLGFHYNYGKIEANDANSTNAQFRDRNLNFTTPLNEFSLLFDFNLINLYSYGVKKRFTPFIFAGIGSVLFNPKTVYDGTTYNLRLLRTEAQERPYRSYALTIPYGIGAKYKFKESWTIFSQIGYRSPLTDYIDDVSGVYADKNSWGNGSSAAVSSALSDRSGEKTGVFIGDRNTQRGDFRKRDNYMFVGIGISYTFVSQKCFTF